MRLVSVPAAIGPLDAASSCAAESFGGGPSTGNEMIKHVHRKPFVY
jgi:hypothetical protein